MSLPLIQPMTGGGGVSATSNSTPSLPITSNAGNYLAESVVVRLITGCLLGKQKINCRQTDLVLILFNVQVDR